MKNIRLFLVLLFVVTALDSCSDKKNFCIGSIKTVRFEKEYKVAGEHINVDSLGVNKVMVIDRYLITGLYKQEYSARIYDLESLNLIGNFFRKGKGPNDFIQPLFSQVRSPYLVIDDWGSRRIKVINIPESINDPEGRLSIRYTANYSNAEIVEPEKVLYVSDTLLLIKSYDMYRETVSYFKYNPVEQKVTDEINMFNYPITEDIQFKNMISLLDCIKPDGSKIVTTAGCLDQLDILDIVHPDKSISVTENDYLLDYEYVKSLDNRKVFYTISCCSDNLICALYNGGDVMEIHIMDWNGNPVCKLILDRQIIDFTVDFDSGFMYAVSPLGEEMIYRYDIRDNILNGVAERQ
ncbi:MAG: TolB-like 6-bladed beta-propeller domain-containing protein [Prevotellaceae bacterium]|nr:TolB-like 6-bladed beta-propeller domain-containing protein [Prevotellaceae bacterium]